MKRADALVVIRVAGYHDDSKTFVRTYTENRISYTVAMKEFSRGQNMNKGGVPCSCNACKEETK